MPGWYQLVSISVIMIKKRNCKRIKLLHRLGYPFSRTSITNSSSAALSRVERSNEPSRTTRGLQILHRDIERGSGMTERKNNITF